MAKKFLPLLLIFSICISLATSGRQAEVTSWSETQKNGHGGITIYWYTSTPFILNDNQGNLTGIEYEIMENFCAFLKKRYGVSVQINWIKGGGFLNTFNKIHQENVSGTFAVSAFSVTQERKQKVKFSPPYMSDISVMISSNDLPIVTSPTQFDTVFNNLTAISIKGTTYEEDLNDLKEKRALNFKIKQIPSNQNILQTIEKRDKSFGYIDLPIYLLAFNNNTTVNVKRQNLFSIKREGYSIIFPKNSDWSEPISRYFNDPIVKKEIQIIISKYIDYEIYNFIESHYADNISLLTKEKEIQYRELLEKALQIQENKTLRNGMVVVILITLTFSIITYFMYKKRNKAALQLEQHQQMIHSQQKDIEQQKELLEKKSEMMTLYNNEKNNLIKVLAHDLRTPINHIQGLAKIFEMENPDLTQPNSELIEKIITSSDRLLKMISKILDIDAIEENRVNLLKEDTQINKLLSNVVESFEKQALAKNITLKLVSPEDALIAKVDPLFLTEVFENLLSNAIKFSHKETAVTISLKSQGKTILIDVSDQGPGISVEDQQHLFKKYQTLSSKPTGGEPSTGLGLSIVKKYVELMGGTISCKSELGVGSTFTIQLEKQDL